MSHDTDADIARLRAIALGLPGAAEKVSHGMPFFFVEKGKGFAQYWPDHHQDRRYAVMVRTSGAEEQAMLIEADPDLYYRPAYIGASGWIAIRTDMAETDWDHIADRVASSWRLAAPKKLLREHLL